VTYRIRRTTTALAATLAVAVGAAACTGGGSDGGSAPDSSARSSAPVFPASEVQPLVEGITHKTVKPLPTPRLADGLTPPTNRWFSGLVFGEQAQPVFPLPLTFGLTDDGFAFGLPQISSTEKAILGGFKPDVAVTNGAESARVSAYDTLQVTMDSLDAEGKVIGRTTIAQGSPYVSYRAEQGGELTTPLAFARSGDHWTAKAGNTTYGLVVDQGSVSGGTVALEEGGTATWFAVPADSSPEKLAAQAAPLEGTAVRYAIEDEEVTTTLSYGKSDTAFAALPHQQKTLADGATCDLGTYPSIYGTLQVCSGTELSWTTPVSEPTGELDLESISGDQRQQLTEQVTQDIAGLKPFPADTYFGGKALYRAAMLYRLATQLELAGPTADIQRKLATELTKWTEPKGCETRPAFCFVYDDKTKGVVGLTPSFGSEEFNDHHFHYGYFLYAAGVLAADDPALASKWAPVMDLLAADIGSAGSSSDDAALFPERRVFDAYAGHSWASGTAPFADGNNQESSSEAVTAWTGLALWAKARDNAALETEATWMLSSEAQSGLAYWTNFDPADPVYSGYGHRIVALNWGGKRDYATWFSPEPAAMLGILVIPMSPASTYLAGDPARIEANVAEATGAKGFDQKFGDYLLMYSALAGDEQRKAALATGQQLDSKWIDDGNSRSYLLAWLMAEHS